MTQGATSISTVAAILAGAYVVVDSGVGEEVVQTLVRRRAQARTCRLWCTATVAGHDRGVRRFRDGSELRGRDS